MNAGNYLSIHKEEAKRVLVRVRLYIMLISFVASLPFIVTPILEWRYWYIPVIVFTSVLLSAILYGWRQSFNSHQSYLLMFALHISTTLGKETQIWVRAFTSMSGKRMYAMKYDHHGEKAIVTSSFIPFITCKKLGIKKMDVFEGMPALCFNMVGFISIFWIMYGAIPLYFLVIVLPLVWCICLYSGPTIRINNRNLKDLLGTERRPQEAGVYSFYYTHYKAIIAISMIMLLLCGLLIRGGYILN